MNELSEDLNSRIESNQISARIKKRKNYTSAYIDISDADLETELKKEYGLRTITIMVTALLVPLFISIPVLFAYGITPPLSIFVLLILFSATSLTINFLKKRSAPRAMRNVFEFDSDSLLRLFNWDNKFEYIQANKKNRERIFLLFVEHFCNNLKESEISALINKNITDPYEIMSLYHRISSKMNSKAFRSLEEDPRYLKIVEETNRDMYSRLLKISERGSNEHKEIH